MSRAVPKERDDEPQIDIDPRAAERPITPSGYLDLRERFRAETDPTRRAALERTIAHVAVVGPPADRSHVGFGARVLVRGAAEVDRTFTIVGEDEIDIERGFIGEASPLARALLGKSAGETAAWTRPAGTRDVTVLHVAYDDVDTSAA
jgi:transcription elongation GreA/GreB family factor